MSSATSIFSDPNNLPRTATIFRNSIRNRWGINPFITAPLMDAVAFGDSSYLNAVSFALQYRRALGKFDSFLNRVRFYHHIPTDGFFDFPEGAVGYHVVGPNYLRVFERKPVAAAELILRSNAANPVHGLFHPYLDLLRRSNFVAVHV